MAKPKFRPPSKVDALTFPVFGLSWFGTPSAPRGGTNTRNVGTSVIAYCGGGGSAKTGVGNKITVDITTDAPPPDPAATDAAATFGGGGSSTSRQVLISTGEALCFGIHVFRPHDDTWDMIRLLATVGDEIYLYGIPLFQKVEEGGDESEDKKEEAILLGKTNVGQGYGAGAVAYTPLNHGIAVGCENGIVVVYHLKEEKSGDGAW